MTKLITLRAYDNYITAHIVKSTLEAEGIPCYLKDENTIIMQWVWANALGGIKLQVVEADRERAETILNETEQAAAEEMDTPGFWEEDTEQLDSNNRVCIYCGSRNTSKQEFNKRPVFLSWLLLGFPLLFGSRKWHCFHCGKDF